MPYARVSDISAATWMQYPPVVAAIDWTAHDPVVDADREAIVRKLDRLGLMYEIDEKGESATNSHRFHMGAALVQTIRLGDESLDKAVSRYAAALPPDHPPVDPERLDLDTVTLMMDRGFYHPRADHEAAIRRGATLYRETCEALKGARRAEAAHDPAAVGLAMQDVTRSHDALRKLHAQVGDRQSREFHLVEGALGLTHTALDSGSKVVLAAAVPVVAGLFMPEVIAAGGFLGAAKGAALITGFGTAISLGQQMVEAEPGAPTDWHTVAERTLDAAGQSLQIAIGAGVAAGGVTLAARFASSQLPAIASTAKWAAETYIGRGVSGLATGTASELIDHVTGQGLHLAANALLDQQGDPAPELSGRAVLVNALGTAAGNLTGGLIGRTQFKSLLGVSGEQLSKAATLTSSGVTGLVQNMALERSVIDNLTMLATTLGSHVASRKYHATASRPRDEIDTSRFANVQARVVDQVAGKPIAAMQQEAHDARHDLRAFLHLHADGSAPNGSAPDGKALAAEPDFKQALQPVMTRLDALAQAGKLEPDHAAAKELFEQFGEDGGVHTRMKPAGFGARSVFANNVRGVSHRMAAVLVDLTFNAHSSINATGAANAEHLTTVFEGDLLTARERHRRPLTQREVDWIALQTVLTDITGKGRMIDVLRPQKFAPVKDADNNDVGNTGGEIWDHMVKKHPPFANATALPGEVLHGIPAFEIIRSATAKAGYTHADAQRMYAGVLAHHMTGFIANAFAKGQIWVDFDELAKPDPQTGLSALEPVLAMKLKTLHREAIELHGRWRDDIEKWCSRNRAMPPDQRAIFFNQAFKLRLAIDDLPPDIKSQLINDDLQQFTALGIEKWLVTSMNFANARMRAEMGMHFNENATVEQLLDWQYRGPVQAYYEQALALGYGAQFKGRTETTAARLGMIYDAGNVDRGGHFRPVEITDSDAYTAFANHLSANERLQREFLLSAADDLDIVQWFRTRPADVSLLKELALARMSR